MKKILWIICFILFGCNQNTNEEKRSLNVNMTAEPSSFDPRRASDLASASLQFFVNEGLTRMLPNSTGALGLASNIEVSSDRLTYTITLRDASWDNGEKILAHHFLKSWQSLLDPAFPCPNAFLLYNIVNAQEIKEGRKKMETLGVEVLSDNVLKIQLNDVTPYFCEILSFCTLFPLPENQLNNPAYRLSSGPYRIKEHQPGNFIVLEKNPYYWDQKNVQLDSIHINLIKDEMTAYNMFENGDLDLIGMPFSPLPYDLIEPKEELSYQPTSGTMACTFNTTRAPFDNENLRKAIAYSINRDEIVKHVSSTNEIAAIDVVPPILSEKAIQGKRVHNPELAKKHLELALKEMGVEKIRAIDFYTPLNTQSRKIGEVIQSQVKKILGITLNLSHHEPKILMNHLVTRNYQMSLCTFFAQYFDAMNILERLMSKAQNKNYSGWESESYLQALKNYRLATSLKKQHEHLLEAEKVLKSECPITPIFHLNHAFIAHDYVHNIKTNPSGGFYLNHIALD